MKDILMPVFRKHPNGESDRAKVIFSAFVSGDFSYDNISNHPDYLAYASAETLAFILPLMIDEMLRRKDTVNFLIYPMITGIDPNPELSGSSELYKERSAKFVTIADKAIVEKICTFLSTLKVEPPVPSERLDRLLAFWNNRLKSAAD